MMFSEAVERFRADIRRRGLRKLDDDELARVKDRSEDMHHSNVMEGVIPDDETLALFEVLIEERVPAEEWSELLRNVPVAVSGGSHPRK